MSLVLDWKTVKFGEIAEQIIDRIDNPKDSELVDYIGLEHIKSNNLKISNYGKANDVVSSKFVCGKGDIIFGRRRAYLRKLAISDKCALVSTDAMVIRPKDNVSKEFLILTMQTDRFWDDVISRSAGSLSPRIKWRDLSSIDVLLPRLKVQEEISKLIFSVQDEIEKTENLLQISEKFKKSLLGELLMKGIGHKKFKETELGEIPNDWSILSLQKLLDGKVILSHLDGNHGSNYPQAKDFVDVGSGVPYISASNLVNGRVDFSSIKYLSYEKARTITKGIAKDGDVLFANNATVGPCAILQTNEKEIILSTSLTYYRCNPEKLINGFLYFYMTSPMLQNQLLQYMKQTTRNQVPITTQRKLLFIVPPLEEQKEIEKTLLHNSKFGDSLRDYLKSTKKLKEKLTNSLLSRELLMEEPN